MLYYAVDLESGSSHSVGRITGLHLFLQALFTSNQGEITMSSAMTFAMFLSMMAWLAGGNPTEIPSHLQIPEGEHPFAGQELPSDISCVEVKIDIARFGVRTIRLNEWGIESLEMIAPKRPAPPSTEVVCALTDAMEHEVLVYLTEKNGWQKPLQIALSSGSDPQAAARRLAHASTPCRYLVEAIGKIDRNGHRVVAGPRGEGCRLSPNFRLTEEGRLAWRALRGRSLLSDSRIARALSRPHETASLPLSNVA